MTNYSDVVEQLGEVRRQIAKLNTEKKLLEASLISSGDDVVVGEHWVASIVRGTRKTVAWKAIAEKLGASAQMVRGNTSKTNYVSVRMTARRVDE